MKIRMPSTTPPASHFLYCLSSPLKKVPTREFIVVKYHDIRPQKMPSRMNSGICHSSNASSGRSVTARMGSKSRNRNAIVVAVIEAISSGMTEAAVMSSIRISNTKTMPVIGALKIAAMAAPAPQHSIRVVCL